MSFGVRRKGRSGVRWCLLLVETTDTHASLTGYTRSELVTMSDDEVMDREAEAAWESEG